MLIQLRQPVQSSLFFISKQIITFFAIPVTSFACISGQYIKPNICLCFFWQPASRNYKRCAGICAEHAKHFSCRSIHFVPDHLSPVKSGFLICRFIVSDPIRIYNFISGIFQTFIYTYGFSGIYITRAHASFHCDSCPSTI